MAILQGLALVLALVMMAVLNRDIDALDAAVAAAWRAGTPAALYGKWGRASAAGGRNGDGSGAFDAVGGGVLVASFGTKGGYGQRTIGTSPALAARARVPRLGRGPGQGRERASRAR